MNPLLAAIGKYGLGTVLAGYLVYQLAGQLPAIQTQNVQILNQHQIMQQSLLDLKQEGRESNQNVQKIMRSVCLILAKENAQQIQSCNP